MTMGVSVRKFKKSWLLRGIDQTLAQVDTN